jgi:hypothetical protein
MLASVLSIVCTVTGAIITALPAAAQPVPVPLLANVYTVANASARSALCNDGSPAAYYYRNCTANWDRHPGDPTDYCAVPDTIWVIIFESDGRFVYNSASAASRPTNLTTSVGLPPTLFPQGVASVDPEGNPNLYKQHTVVVPSCSSDLHAGTGATSVLNGSVWHFGGAAIARAVLADLFTPAIPAPRLGGANSVLIVGDAGIMTALDDLANIVRAGADDPARPPVVLGACDGCALFDVTPYAGPPTPARCTDDTNCPPSQALPAAVQLWGAATPAWCNITAPSAAASCLLATTLLPYLATRSRTHALVHADAYDATQLAMNGAWPVSSQDAGGRMDGSALAYADTVFGPAVTAALAGCPYGFLAACASPPQSFLTDAYVATAVTMRDQYGHFHLDALGVAVPSFLDAARPGGQGPASFGRYADNCTTFGCNPSGCSDVGRADGASA